MTPAKPRLFGTLRQLAKPAPRVERCELCAKELAPEHQHLVEPAARRLVCCCDPCAILFDGPNPRYRRVPRRVRALPGFRMTDAAWHELHIPIELAFFLTGSAGVTAVYPGPAGAIESPIPAHAWAALVAANPALGQLEPEVEALLANRVNATHEYFRVPIDECYRLVGLIRSKWHGLSGGEEVWAEIGRFFERLRERAGGGVCPT